MKNPKQYSDGTNTLSVANVEQLLWLLDVYAAARHLWRWSIGGRPLTWSRANLVEALSELEEFVTAMQNGIEDADDSVPSGEK